jgi:hypothetical protein
MQAAVDENHLCFRPKDINGDVEPDGCHWLSFIGKAFSDD